MATLFDSASLVMIPSGVKESKLYSVKPSNGDGDFTFSRGTDTATRVNASGLIEKERANLLLQSNTFDTTWTLSNASVTGGHSGYDGSNDAWELTSTSTSSARIQQFESNTGVQSLSIYAKAGTANFIIAEKAGTNGFYAWFDLSNGTIGNTSGDIDTTIEDVGGGWYRCSISGNPSTSTKCQFYIVDANGSTAVTNGATIYIQDAQLEQGLVATDYIETTTAAVYEGITDNLPRLDYSGGASCPSLLLEPSRTNGLPQSEYFNAWTALNDVAITANSITSPEGLLNGSLMAASGVGATARNVRQGSQSTSTDVKTLSVYAKANASNYIQLFHSGDAQGYVNFDLANGEVGTSGTNATADIEPMGNDWYRCIATFDSGANFGSSVYIGFATSASASYGGGSVSDTSSVYIFGAQYETGSYPTSYIPTYGTSASRAADFASSPTNALGGVSEGTFFIEMTRDGIDTAITGSGISLRDNSGVEEIRLHFDAPASQVRWRDGNNSFAQIGGVLSITAGTTFKILVKTDGTTAKAFGNGAQLGSDYSVVSAFDFQRIYNNGLGHQIKQQLFFPTALTDAECIALTTL